MSLIASHVSGIMLLGTGTEIYLYGTQYCFIFISICLSATFLHYIIIPVLHEIQVTSVYEVGWSGSRAGHSNLSWAPRPRLELWKKGKTVERPADLSQGLGRSYNLNLWFDWQLYVTSLDWGQWDCDCAVGLETVQHFFKSQAKASWQLCPPLIGTHPVMLS